MGLLHFYNFYMNYPIGLATFYDFYMNYIWFWYHFNNLYMNYQMVLLHFSDFYINYLIVRSFFLDGLRPSERIPTTQSAGVCDVAARSVSCSTVKWLSFSQV